MLGFLGEAAEAGCSTLSPHQTRRECALLLRGTTARLFPDNRPAGLPGRETASFLLHSTPATQHFHDRHPSSFTLSAHRAKEHRSPHPEEVAATATRLRTRQEDPRRHRATSGRASGAICSRHVTPRALHRAIFQSDSWSFTFDSLSGLASKRSLKPFPPSRAEERSLQHHILAPTTWWVRLKH